MIQRELGVRPLRVPLLASTCLSLIWADPAAAQTDEAPAQQTTIVGSQQGEPTSDESMTVQDIVVTATRRDANLQVVPVTITALPADALKALNIDSVLELSDAVPGLQVSPSGGNNIFLRGVGSINAGYNDAQVATYIDGIYLPNPAMSIFSFNNIEQVEVLKGPQGTLYGRNATAGLVAVTTRDPGDALRLDASVGYESFNKRTESLYLSTPITSTLAANVAVYDTKQVDGWGRNVFTGNDAQKARETAVQAKLLWRPAGGTKVTANFIYDTNDRSYGFGYQILPGTIGVDGTPYLGEYRSASRVDARAPFKAYIGSLRVQQELGFADLTSLTAYQRSDQKPLFPQTAILGQPVAGQGAVIFNFDETSSTWTEELQLASRSSSSRLDWVAGLFLYHDVTQIASATNSTCIGTVCAPFVPNLNTGRVRTESYSGYVDATYRILDATRVTLGVRYTDESKRLTGSVVPLAGFPNSVATLPPTFVTAPGQPYPGNPAGIPTELNFGKLTYRAVLAQDVGPNVHAYLSYNLGFKSGAFNINLFTNPPVRPELLDAYEAGVKTELFDRRLRLNLAVFRYDYTDVQVRSFAPPAPPGSALVQNVAAERIKGLDGDFTLVVTDDLSINGGFEILDAKYRDYPGATCSSPGPSRIVNGVLVGSVTSVTCDLAGSDVAYAPSFSSTIGIAYGIDTDQGRFTFNLNDRYTARHPLSPDQSVYAPRSHLVNANLGWTSADKRFDAQVYVRNLFDKYTYVGAFPSAAGIAIVPGAPRIFGAALGFHY